MPRYSDKRSQFSRATLKIETTRANQRGEISLFDLLFFCSTRCVRSCKIGRSETKIQGDPRGRIRDQPHPRARARHLQVVRPSFPVIRAPRPPRDPAEWPTLSALTPRPSPIPLSPGGGDENPPSPRPGLELRPTTFCSVLNSRNRPRPPLNH